MWWPDQGPGTLETTHRTITSLQSTVYSELWVDFYSNLMATRGREIVTRMAAATLQRQDLIKCPETLSWDNTLYVHTLYVHSRGSGPLEDGSVPVRTIGASEQRWVNQCEIKIVPAKVVRPQKLWWCFMWFSLIRDHFNFGKFSWYLHHQCQFLFVRVCDAILQCPFHNYPCDEGMCLARAHSLRQLVRVDHFHSWYICPLRPLLLFWLWASDSLFDITELTHCLGYGP